jgi:hypothetical protein
MNKMKLLYSIENGYIKIEQTSKRNFQTTYGLQVKTFDNWQSAFENFGYCLAHHLECESILSR